MRLKAASRVCFLLLIVAAKGAAAPDTGISFQPIFLPLQVRWSPQSGISVSFRGPQLPVLVGTVSFDITFVKAMERFPAKNVLIIVAGNRSYVYDLRGQHCVLQLPDNLRGHVTLEYSRGNIRLKIPHPERLSSPRVISGHTHPSQTTSPSRSVVAGSFELDAEQGFSFGMRRVQPANAGDLNFWDEIFANGIIDLGPIELSAVKSVPIEQRDVLSAFTRPLSILAGKDTPTYWGQAQPRAGHTYAIRIGPTGPFAVVRIVDVQMNDLFHPIHISCRYRFQTNGSPQF
jgi:hypothetical protein